MALSSPSPTSLPAPLVGGGKDAAVQVGGKIVAVRAAALVAGALRSRRFAAPRAQAPVRLWSIDNAGAPPVHQATILAGTPATVAQAGTCFSTTLPAPTLALSPTVMLPSRIAPAPSNTPLPTF